MELEVIFKASFVDENLADGAYSELRGFNLITTSGKKDPTEDILQVAAAVAADQTAIGPVKIQGQKRRESLQKIWEVQLK